MSNDEAVLRIENAFKRGVAYLASKGIDRGERALFWQGAGMGAFIAKQLTPKEIDDFIALSEKEWTKACEEEKCSVG